MDGDEGERACRRLRMGGIDWMGGIGEVWECRMQTVSVRVFRYGLDDIQGTGGILLLLLLLCRE